MTTPSEATLPSRTVEAMEAPRRPSPRPASAGALHLLGLLLVGCVPWASMILEGEVPMYMDASPFFQARRAYLEHCQLEGAPPFWDPGRAFGQPGLGSPDNSAAYPPTQLAVYLFGGDRAVLWEGLFHTLLSLFLSYALFCHVLENRTSAALAAIVYSLSGMTLGVHWNPHHYAAIAWLPGVALGALADRRCLLVVSLSAMALSPEPILLATCVVLLTVFWTWQTWRTRTPRVLLVVPVLGAVLCLGAAQLAPMAEFIPLTVRDSDWSLEQALAMATPLHDVPTLAFPRIASGDHEFLAPTTWLRHLYCGFLSLLCIVHALRHASRGHRTLWIFLAACLLTGLGERPPLYVLFHDVVPGFDRLRFPPKFLPLATLCIAYFVGRAWEDGRRLSRWCWGVGAGFVVLHVGCSWLKGVDAGAFVLSLSGVVAAGVALVSRARCALLLPAVLLVGLDLALHADLPSIAPDVVERSVLGKTLQREAQPGERFARLGPESQNFHANELSETDLYRNRLRELQLNSCRLVGVDWAFDYWSLTSRNVYKALEGRKDSFLAEFPIQLVLVPDASASPLDTANLQPLAADRGLTLYRRLDAPAAVQFPGTVTVHRSMRRVVFEVDSEAGGALIDRETYLPGWSATVDGQTWPLTEADGWCRRVDVPAGPHTVEMVYVPPGSWGLGLSAAAWLVLLGWRGRSVVPWVRRRVRERASQMAQPVEEVLSSRNSVDSGSDQGAETQAKQGLL